MYPHRRRDRSAPSVFRGLASGGGAWLGSLPKLPAVLAAAFVLLGGSAALALGAFPPHVLAARSVNPQPRRNRHPKAPLLRVHGHTLRWSRVAGARRYVVETILRRAGGGTRMTKALVTGTTATPTPHRGRKVSYRVRAHLPGAPW